MKGRAVDTTTQTITILILLVTLVTSVIATQFIRRRRDVIALRQIAAYQAVPLMVGEAIEANRPIHMSLGSAGIGGSNTLLALVSAEMFFQVARRAAIGATSPILTVSDPTAIPLGQDMLRRAYQSRDLVNRYKRGNVRWYPSGPRSLAFAAALTATLGDDKVAANVLMGSFGAELALVAEAAQRRNQSLIATSDQLEGQAVAFAMSDQPLIGEEIFTAGAYMDGKPSHIAALVAQDVLRWLLILALLVPTALAVGDAILNGRFTAALGRLLGGG
jgi:hypothetical protein